MDFLPFYHLIQQLFVIYETTHGYISNIISTGFHGSTFGGGMLQTRVSYNVLKSINTKSFLNKVLINGKLLSSLLRKIHDNHKDKIVDTRCLGLMAGIEFKNDEIALKTCEVHFETILGTHGRGQCAPKQYFC